MGGYIIADEPINRSHHAKKDWVNNPEELQIGLDVAVIYSHNGRQTFTRHENVVEITDTEFVTEIVSDEAFGAGAVGYILEVYPYTEETRNCINQSREHYIITSLMGNSIKIENILPEDYAEAIELYRKLNTLVERKIATDIETIRNQRKEMWDIAKQLGFTSKLKFIDPYSEDWDKDPEDIDFGNRKWGVHSRFSAERFLKTVPTKVEREETNESK